MSSHGPVTLATLAMGTRFELVLAGGDEPALRAAGEEAIALIEDAHRRLTRFTRGGPIAEINACAGLRAVRVDDEVFALLDRCAGYSAATGGAFSVVTPAQARAHDRPSSPTHDPAGALGSPALVLDPQHRTAFVDRPGSIIDLGGVAKGFAIDLATASLNDSAVTDALIHGGSSTIAVVGAGHLAAAGHTPVRIEIATHDGSPGPVAHLRPGRALSVSSQSGDRSGHVVDPRTGRPATASPAAACLGNSAEETDAWSTALVVLGRRPETMPARLTSVIRSNAADGPGPWLAEGPDRDLIQFPPHGDPT